MRVTINFGKKHLVFLIGIFVFLGVGVFVIAEATTTTEFPGGVGHNADNILIIISGNSYTLQDAINEGLIGSGSGGEDSGGGGDSGGDTNQQTNIIQSGDTISLKNDYLKKYISVTDESDGSKRFQIYAESSSVSEAERFEIHLNSGTGDISHGDLVYFVSEKTENKVKYWNPFFSKYDWMHADSENSVYKAKINKDSGSGTIECDDKVYFVSSSGENYLDVLTTRNNRVHSNGGRGREYLFIIKCE